MNDSKIKNKRRFPWLILAFLFAFMTRANAEILTQDAALKLMMKSGCAACHNIEKTLVGPAYKEVGARYANPTAEVKAYLKGQKPEDYLFTKVRTGTKVGVNKNWIKSKEGRSYGMMTPNPAGRISDENLKSMIEFILSLK
jgi:mono/diheme cytochrome c family protein